VLTARGRDFRPVIVALLAFGNRHFAPEGASVLLVDARTGRTADPILVDRKTGRPIEAPDYIYTPGPAAGEHTRRKLAVPPVARMERKRNPGPRKRSAT
jgi:hypothetical protein